MKVVIKKNIRYKKKSYKAGQTVKIEREDIENIRESDVIERECDSPQELESVEEVGASKSIDDYEEMTKAEISDLLDDLGINYNVKDRKDELIKLLLGSE